jgi:transposase InsO family protein
LPGEPVRDMMIEAVEARFGNADERAVTLEFLSDNGGAFRANETHALAHELGIKPVDTPVNSPQSNGIAETFVNTFKRLRRLHGPQQRCDRAGSTAGCVQAFQRGSSAFNARLQIAAHVQERATASGSGN